MRCPWCHVEGFEGVAFSVRGIASGWQAARPYLPVRCVDAAHSRNFSIYVTDVQRTAVELQQNQYYDH